MFNIDVLCNYNEEQLTNYENDFPLDSIQYKEPRSFFQYLFKYFIILLLVMVCLVCMLLTKTSLFHFNINNFKYVFIYSCLISLISSVIHKFLHAFMYPSHVIKDIYKSPKLLFSFYSQNVQVSKKRYILICIFPNLILGFIPFMLWIMGMFDFNEIISDCILIFSTINIFIGLRDYLNIFSTLEQVPNDAIIFKYGIHNYWRLPESIKIP